MTDEMANWRQLTATDTPRTIMVNLGAVAAMTRFAAQGHTEILLIDGHRLDVREDFNEIFTPKPPRFKWKGEA